MFITIQINYYAYVTTTTRQLFRVVTIEIDVSILSVYEYINNLLDEYQVSCSLDDSFGDSAVGAEK